MISQSGAKTQTENEQHDEKIFGWTKRIGWPGGIIQDVAAIKFPKAIGAKSLKVRAEEVPNGAKVFALGYPNKTERHAKGRNAVGDIMHVSPGTTHSFVTGKVDSLPGWSMEKYDAETKKKFIEFVEHVFIFGDFNLAPGNSGGALVDENGELISMTGIAPDPKNNSDITFVTRWKMVKAMLKEFQAKPKK